MTFQNDVREFHIECGFHVGEFGAIPPLEVRRARARLVWEEARELIVELLADDPEFVYGLGLRGLGPHQTMPRPVDPVRVAHEAADLHYVTSGASVNFGYDEGVVFAAVHTANMQKAWLADREVGDEHGKARKPAHWQPPNIAAVLRPAGMSTENAENAARWLAEQSRHPRYQGEDWRRLLTAEANVDHASRCATSVLPPGASTQDITEAAGILFQYIRRTR